VGGSVAPRALVGRFAPSPTGELHLGNLRTALIGWLMSRAMGGRFVVRMEDLDPVTSSPAARARQLDDLQRLGLDWDGEVVVQSERFERYDAAITKLIEAGALYECYCTRREIREAASAPHGDHPEGGYPGTCRRLTDRQRSERRAEGRRGALRLDGGQPEVEMYDGVHGVVRGVADDVVVRRNDGLPAYNLAVIVDDASQGVTQVVRGEDLLTSTPRQLQLARLLGLTAPSYAHVRLVVGSDGERLSKRNGALSVRDLEAAGWSMTKVRGWLAQSLGAPPELSQSSMNEILSWFAGLGAAEWCAMERARGERPTIPGSDAPPPNTTVRPTRR
jgi:glutamyl-tRNA synthetase